MTGRPVFGDFTRLAAAQLQPPGGPDRTGSGTVGQAGRSLLRVTAALDSFLTDITAAFAWVPPGERRLLSGWAQAGVQARDAVRQASAHLRQIDDGHDGPRSSEPEGVAARRLTTASAALTAGHDLLHTHFAPGLDGVRTDISEWAPVIASVPVSRALLSEIAVAARRAAAVGTDAAMRQPGARGTPAARQRLVWACQWLQAADSVIQPGLRRDPVAADSRLLLYAIPVNGCSPRRVPDGAEPVAGLCDGAVSTAQRLRHTARVLPAQASWSPAMTITGLRQVAVTSTVTSRNCEVLLRALAASAARSGSRHLTVALTESADAAGHACTEWLHLARELKEVTTDTRGYLSPVAAEAGDLALWTGRLAYADPEWNLASGPSHQARPVRSLAGEQGGVPSVVAAVHQAFETLTHLARTDQDQVRAAAAAGRLLVPTSSLPDTIDIPHPFAPAPPKRVHALLDVYGGAGQASRGASAAIDGVAVAVQAPSQVLTRARAALEATRSGTPRHATTPSPAADADQVTSRDESPGPVGQLLHYLGVTRADLLQRACDIDSASYQLIMTAADDMTTQSATPDVGMSRGSADLLSYVLSSADARAAALLRPGIPARAGPGPHERQAEP